MSYEADRKRYLDAAHAVQSGLALLEHTSPQMFTPKHLRVGIDTSKVEQAALATLAIAKGIFTKEEYMTALADAMEAEQKRSEVEIGAKLV